MLTRKPKRKSWIGRFAALVISFLLLPALSKAGSLVYNVIDLGVLPGGTSSAAAGISSNGAVTGFGDSAAAVSQPFLWTSVSGLSAVDAGSLFAFCAGINASATVVGYGFSSDFSTYSAFIIDGSTNTSIPTLPGGSNNAATAINDSGTVVGYSNDASGAIIGFSYASHTLTSLGTLPGGTTSQANAINASGTIVGQADGFDGLLHAVVASGGNWADLGVLAGYQSSFASAISNNGFISGTLNDGSGGTMAFLWQSGSMSALGALLPGGDSRAYGVNSAGVVVGSSDGTAFLYDNTGMHDLNGLLSPTSAWLFTEADAINDSGQIAAIGFYGGQQHAFLLDPVSTPEPATLPLLCGALLLLAAGELRHFQFRKAVKR